MAGGKTLSNMHLSKLQTLKAMLLFASEAMSTTSEKSLTSEIVWKNFINLLKSASPQLKLAIMLLTPWMLLGAALSKFQLFQQSLVSLKNFAASMVNASVSIPGSHPLNKQILSYMADRGLGQNARTLALASPNAANGRPFSVPDEFYLLGRDPRRAAAKRNLNAEEEDRQKQALSYVPEVGTYTFWWKCYRMTFERQKSMQEQVDGKGRVSYVSSVAGNETIVISCPTFFTGARPIQEFLNHIKTAPAKDNTTTIYRPDIQNSTWDAGITRPARNLNAVTLDANVKDELVKDIETYLAPETRKYYANRGIPWRRGYLFYGNPGTGKTSFSSAIGGHLNMNIYMIALSNTSLTDTMLETLFEQLPSRCIVLLEDIDSAGIERENMRKEFVKNATKSGQQQQFYDEQGRPMSAEMYARRVGGVTLSGLLNVLDGIHSKEGCVTILTSNSPDSLDPALVRPGRIDRKVLFGYASREIIGKLFVHIFSKAPDEMTESEKAGEQRHDINSFADAFADIVPANKLTPAEVQGFLLVHREDPVEALQEAGVWVQKTLETKEKGANVEAFAGQEESQSRKSKSGKKSSTATACADRGRTSWDEDEETSARESKDADDSTPPSSVSSSDNIAAQPENAVRFPPADASQTPFDVNNVTIGHLLQSSGFGALPPGPFMPGAGLASVMGSSGGLAGTMLPPQIMGAKSFVEAEVKKAKQRSRRK